MGCCISKESRTRKSKKRRKSSTNATAVAEIAPGLAAQAIVADHPPAQASSNPLGRNSRLIMPSTANPFLVATTSSGNNAPVFGGQPRENQPAQPLPPADGAGLSLTADRLRSLCSEEPEESFQSMRGLSDTDMEEELRSASLQSNACFVDTPEGSTECQSIAELLRVIKAGALQLPPLPPGAALHVKVKFRDMGGWFAELGCLPAPIKAVNGNPLRTRLCSKSLERNHRLLQQLRRSLKTSSFVEENQLGAEGRRGSTSTTNSYRMDEEEGFALEGFYQELDDEERRLSQLEDEISDDGEKM